MTQRYVERTSFGTAPITRAILAEQQQITDTFFGLKLIPKKLNLLHAAPVDLSDVFARGLERYWLRWHPGYQPA